MEIRIPRISFKNTPINNWLVIALVIFSFLTGMLFNKVTFLENALKDKSGDQNNVLAANNIAPPPPSDPAAPIAPAAKVDVALGDLPVLGAEDAKVTVVEFSDLQCPFCKQFVDTTYPQLYEEYIKTNKIKFAFRHYPLTSIHPNAQKAGEAAECANEQNKFWEYHDLLFQNQDAWSPQAAAAATTSFVEYAGELGLDTTTFQSCLDTDKYKAKVEQDTAEGTQAGVDGTPAFFINGTRITGAQPFTEFQRLIEEELNK
jgi:protein-disulfide isomerase